ncbi:unnamed protein product, partial [Brassica oleracea var. botrytis]
NTIKQLALVLSVDTNHSPSTPKTIVLLASYIEAFFISFMEIESVRCECCGLMEDCTQAYISEVKSNFDNKWLCGLCSEAVREEVSRRKMTTIDEAVRAHMSFCGKFKDNPAVLVADGMRQMLRRRSSDLTSSASKKVGRSNSTKLY